MPELVEKTVSRIRRPQRWDVPFGAEMTEVDVARVLWMEPFASIDQTKFPAATPLPEIIRNDCRINHYKNGDIIVRKGDYGHSLFFVMSGKVRVALDALPDRMLGRLEPQRKTIWRAVAQLWENHSVPEFREAALYQRAQAPGAATRGEGDQTRVFLQDIPAILSKYKTATISEGEFFGELAALGRVPRAASVFADGDCELLELRWQGFRDIRRRADNIRQYIDKIYRERSLINHLRSTPIFSHLTDAQLGQVADATVFETYGDFDWHASYKKLSDADPAKRLAHEPIIAEQGHYPNGVILIRAGFARLSCKHGNGERTMGYLGRGKTYGFEELSHNHSSSPTIPLQRTLRAIGYVDVLRVPTVVVERFVLNAGKTLPEVAHTLDQVKRTETAVAGLKIRTGMLEFLVENRFINGNATMIIDLDRCTRCDDCVRACAASHDGNPRFIRHGPQYGHHMIANACMHCTDPVCMIGCPTGAIHRDPFGGQVLINDSTCIGCATCANSCPYHNIRMVEVRDGTGQFIIDETTNAPIQKATKCDLCSSQLGGPACQRACPHDALRRVEMSDLEALSAWVNR